MKIKLCILNTLLRMTVKPFLSFTSIKNIPKKRKILKKISSMIPLRKGFTNSPICFNEFKGEEIRHHSICHTHDKVILYFPGGAYVTGSHYSHRNITTRLSKLAQAKVVAIDYRKAPEHPYPYPVIDAMKSYQHLLDEGYEPKNISFVGDSAGGHLHLFHIAP